MKHAKRFLSVMLVIVTMFCICSFDSFAASFVMTVSDSDLLVMQNEYKNAAGATVISNIRDFSHGVQIIRGETMHYFHANDPAFYNSGQKKIALSASYSDFAAGHEYETEFYTNLNYTGTYSVEIWLGSSLLYSNSCSSSNGLSKTKVRFTAPDFVSDSTFFSIYIVVPEQYAYGSAGQNVRYYVSETIEVVDTTENPGWLEKVITAIKEIPTKVTALGQTIGNFFSDLISSVGALFKDLKESIQNKFIELGENIGKFFTSLKNYMLYFTDPVTLNSDGVLVDKSGKPIYTNPFASSIEKIKDTLDSWMLSINNFLNGMEDSRKSVSGYLKSGTDLVNGVLKSVPILTVCLTFAVGFCVVRKVVGR